jgi:hypothetical protein
MDRAGNEQGAGNENDAVEDRSLGGGKAADSEMRERRMPHPGRSLGTDAIGRLLARVYDEAASEPVPSHLLQLLGRLDGGSGKTTR